MTNQRRLKPYHVEMSLRAGRDVVWDALTNAAVLRQWFGWEYDGLDAEIQQIFVDQAARLGARRMGWADGSYLEVSGGRESCTVRVIREGPPPADPDRYDAIEEAWRAFLVQLRHLVEQKPSGRRRTLYLTGRATGRQALDLAGGGWEWDGRRVAWTVDADGDLVVVAGHLPLDARDPGRLEVTVSTYGLNDAAFGERRETWTKRWNAVVADGAVTIDGMPAPS